MLNEDELQSFKGNSLIRKFRGSNYVTHRFLSIREVRPITEVIVIVTIVSVN